MDADGSGWHQHNVEINVLVLFWLLGAFLLGGCCPCSPQTFIEGPIPKAELLTVLSQLW
jgi:hypothetical protein